MEKKLLKVELVPETCWFANLRSVLSRMDWDRLRKRTYQKADNCCEVCGGRGRQHSVECHEIWEYDDVKHVQKLVGLIAFCPGCHEVAHMGLAEIRGRMKEAKRRMASVNGWPMKKVVRHVAKAFEVWNKRSQYEWTMDLSWLDQFGIKVKRR